MTSNRPKHIERSSTDSTSGDTMKARALETSSAKQSDSAIMKPTALSIDSEKLMEQIVEEANMALALEECKSEPRSPWP